MRSYSVILFVAFILYTIGYFTHTRCNTVNTTNGYTLTAIEIYNPDDYWISKQAKYYFFYPFALIENKINNRGYLKILRDFDESRPPIISLGGGPAAVGISPK